MASLRNVYMSFVFIAFGGLLFGYIIGINGNVATKGQLICPDDWTGSVGTLSSFGYGQCYDLGDWGAGILSSMNLVGATMASLICFRFADDLGRKREVQLGAALYLVGSLATALAPTLWAIHVGFLVYGLGIGFAMHAAPVYIAEISPAEIRGTLVSAKEGVIVLGMFMGFASGAVFSVYEQSGWRVMVGLAAFFAAIMEVGITVVHRSPRWLLLQSARQGGSLLGTDGGRWIEEARASLRFFRRGAEPEEVEQELRAIQADAVAAVGQQQVSCAATFQHPKPLFIGCGLVFLQQVTGQPSVLYFATNIFKSAGFASTAALSSVGVGLVKLLATLFTVWRVDEFGRRQLLLWGIGLMVLALSVLAVAFLFRECEVAGMAMSACPQDQVTLPRPWAIATVIALMIYVSGYQVGFGPISWLMISEIFPLGVRGAALSTAAMVNFGSNILMTLTQTALMTSLTPAGLFFAYLALSLVSLVFVFKIVPETKGKTLEAIEQEMTGRKQPDPVGSSSIARDLAVHEGPALPASAATKQ